MVFIEVYTRDGCSACVNAKKILNDSKATFQEYKVGRDVTREQVLEKFPGAKSLPVIIVDGVQVADISSFKMLLEG